MRQAKISSPPCARQLGDAHGKLAEKISFVKTRVIYSDKKLLRLRQTIDRMKYVIILFHQFAFVAESEIVAQQLNQLSRTRSQ
jgi:hypothetical protein